jgi:hypothetical protein
MYGVYQHQDGQGIVWHSARTFSYEQDAENYAVSLTIRARKAGMIGASYWPELRD